MADTPSSPAVLVTGSSRGLGRGIAETLASHGFSVAIHYSGNAAAADQTAASCRELATSDQQKFPIVQANLGLKADRDRLIQEVIDGLGRLDALVNNAGVAPKQRLDITEATEESWDEVLEVNLKAPYFLSQSAVNYWLEHKGESLIESGYKLLFIGSISAYTASINRGEYCIAKAGLSMANQLWGARLAPEGIQTYELRAGIMQTDMTSGVTEKYEKIFAETDLVPQKRWGQPADIGRAVLSILNGQFAFSTGETLNIDGGFHLQTL